MDHIDADPEQYIPTERLDTPPNIRKDGSLQIAASSLLALLSGASGHQSQHMCSGTANPSHTIHIPDDGLSGRVTANSGVSFCISKSSRGPITDQASHQPSSNNTGAVSSAVVKPVDPEQSAAATGARSLTLDHMKNDAVAPKGIFLGFEDVGYSVTKKRHYCAKWGRTSSKRILQGITGWAAPGEMLALMGPSGSGKTTLLNVLGGRNQPDQDVNVLTGSILYDGAPYSKTLKPRFGFVTQEDMLYPHLTVKETLTYAALLRLPPRLSRKHKADKADQVIRQLGLERCCDTIIGNAFLRGVSGGERKRVCIGHEILIDPSILFLDEPTSGLDSTTALRIMSLLRSLAQSGRSVITTIHQPSSRVFYLFDKLLLLAEGQCVYFGKAGDAMRQFEGGGFAPLVPMNPADFLLDLCSGNTLDIKLPPAMAMNVPVDLHYNTVALELDRSSSVISLRKEVVRYLVDCNAKEVTQMTKDIRERIPKLCTLHVQIDRTWALGWASQVAILLERGLKERRHDYLGWLKVTQVMATAVLCGTLWWHSKATSQRELEDQVGLLFFISLFWGFFPLFNAIFTFPLERALLIKERSSDMYRLSAYFVARSVSDLPLDLLLPTCFVTLVYFMATLHMSIAAFTLTMLAIYITVVCAQGFGLLIGATLMDVKKATTFGSVLVIALMLAAGFFVQQIPNCVAWIKYLSFQSYCYKLLIKIQYFPIYNIHVCSREGQASMTCKQAISLNRALHGMMLSPGFQEVWALMALALVSRILAYLALRNIRFNSIEKTIRQCLQPKNSSSISIQSITLQNQR